MAEKFEKYSVEYGYGLAGSRWCMDVMATSPADAMARLRAAASFGTVSGIVVMEMPAAAGAWLPRFICAALNYLRGK